MKEIEIPQETSSNYTSTLATLLTWYSINASLETKKKFLVEYDKKYEVVPESYCGTMGAIARLITRGFVLNEKSTNAFETRCNELFEQFRPRPSPDKPAIHRRPKVNEETNICNALTMVDKHIDAITQDGERNVGVEVLPKLTPTERTEVIEYLDKIQTELKESMSGESEDLVDAHSTNRWEKKRIVQYIDNVKTAILDTAKKKRKSTVTRKTRKFDVLKAVSKMTYRKESELLDGRVSVHPKDVYGSSAVLLLNEAYKTITLLVGTSDKLTIKGSTIYNIDPNKSLCKGIRKIDGIDLLLAANRQGVYDRIKEMKTRERKVTGRVNENSIILKVY